MLLRINNVDYQFEDILLKKKKIKSEIIKTQSINKTLKIAVMSGSTINEIADELEVFLLSIGIKPVFYFSQYNKYYEESVYPKKELLSFKPDVIFVHTCYRNLLKFPNVKTSPDEYKDILQTNQTHFKNIWESLTKSFNCPIVQNNFDLCSFRTLGNLDSSDYRGTNNLILDMNRFFASESRYRKNLIINDLCFLQAKYGMTDFSDSKYWYMYKYALNVKYIPYFSYNLFSIIRSLLGYNKKVLNLDLDNTLWGGVIGDDGLGGIKLGQGNPEGEYFLEFQDYLKSLKDRGIVLTINSKNDYVNALEGFEHPDSILKKDDFIDIQANWEPKPKNIIETASRINLTLDSFVFIDDNLFERTLMRDSFPNVCVLDFSDNAIQALDEYNYFEPINITEDDVGRTSMYRANIAREESKGKFTNYNDYLKSLEMECDIKTFSDLYLNRITQLINKTNQFNFTSNRLTESEVLELSNNPHNICLYAKLKDKYGDNGIVSCIVGESNDKEIVITNWLMSCRVFSRGLEEAVLNTFVELAKEKGFDTIVGIYKKTEKNSLISNFYLEHGFKRKDKNTFVIKVSEYLPKEHNIRIKQ